MSASALRKLEQILKGAVSELVVSGNLMKCTVMELACYLASKIDPEDVLSRPFPDCDFSVLTEEWDGEQDLELIKSGACGWYGIKAVDMGFDSDDLILFADYYGGGSAAFCSIWDQIDCEMNVSDIIADVICETLSYCETADRKSNLIVEFEGAMV